MCNLDEMQLTTKGVERFWELRKGDGPHTRCTHDEETLREYAVLLSLIWLHPLAYPYRAPYELTADLCGEDYRKAAERGHIAEVADNFRHMIDVLNRYGERDLIRVFMTYRKVVRQDPTLETADIWEATNIILKLTKKDAAMLRCPGDEPLHNRALKVKEDINPKNRGDWIVTLDGMIQQIHFDPDLLRHHDQTTQVITCAAIIRWLDQLAGKEGKQIRWIPCNEMEI